jgi:formylmethanofuran dehydrogenase subunit B
MSLAEQTGGTLDHMHGESMIQNVKTVQTTGWMTTTLAEVRNRADLLVFAGTDAVGDHPRFFERVVWNRESLFNLDTQARELVYLGSGLNIKPGISPDGRRPQHLKFDLRLIAEVALALRALLAGQRLRAKAVAGVRIGHLAALLEKMRKARYGVLVWSAAQLDFPHADLAIEALADLVKGLNAGTRFSGLPLGGNDGGITANSLSTWQSGFPLRLNFGLGYPDHDPLRYTTERLLGGGGADFMLWISAYRDVPLPQVTRIPVVVLGRPGTQFVREPEAFIPIATPGLDHRGQVLRCDSVVSLPLGELRQSGLPSVAGVIGAIASAL